MVIEDNSTVADDLRSALSRQIVDSPRIAKVLLGRRVEFTIHFSYGKFGDYQGMRIRILDAQVWTDEYSVEHFFYNQELFAGYSEDMYKKIAEISEQMSKTMYQVHKQLESAELKARLQKAQPDIFEKSFNAVSPETDKIHRWVGGLDWKICITQKKSIRSMWQWCNSIVGLFLIRMFWSLWLIF